MLPLLSYKKRSHAAAFEDITATSKPSKRPRKSKKANEIRKTADTSSVEDIPEANIETKLDFDLNAEAEVDAGVEPNMPAEQTNALPEQLPKSIVLDTVVHQGQKTRYVLDCDENGIPAPRAPFRRSPGAPKTIRDQLGNPIDPKAMIRDEPQLNVVMAKDPETLMREAMANGALRRRGQFANHSPPRSGKMLTLLPNFKEKGNGKAKTKAAGKGNRVAKKETGKGAFHKKSKSSNLPMRRFSVGGARW